MPRKARFIIPGVPLHIVQQGHNRSIVFVDNEDYETYWHWVVQGAERYRCHIHAYVLMPNHIHLLVTPEDNEGVTRMMQYIGRCYVPYINKKYGRTGALWDGRYKGSLIQEEPYLLACMRFIETNPVRSGLVTNPDMYRWSSYQQNIGVKNAVEGELYPHLAYLALGENGTERGEKYQQLFDAEIERSVVNDINRSWQSGTPLGDAVFKREVEALLGLSVGGAKRGRPKKGL